MGSVMSNLICGVKVLCAKLPIMVIDDNLLYPGLDMVGSTTSPITVQEDSCIDMSCDTDLSLTVMTERGVCAFGTGMLNSQLDFFFF